MPAKPRTKGNANVYYWNKCFLHYSYAMVLKSPDKKGAVPEMMTQIIVFLKRAGLRMCFLREDEHTRGSIVLLITAEPYNQVAKHYREFKDALKRRLSQVGAAVEAGRKRRRSRRPDDGVSSVEEKVDGPNIARQASDASTAAAGDTHTHAGTRGAKIRRRPVPGRGPFVCRGMDAKGRPDPATMTLLQRENLKLYNERYLKFGMQSQARVPPDFFDMTTAKKLMLTHRLIVDVVDRVNLEMHGDDSYSRSNRGLMASNHQLLNTRDDHVDSAWDYVQELFPLQDEQWNLRFVRLYMKSLFQWQRWVPPVLRRHVRPSSTVRGGDGPTKQVVLDSSDSDDDAVMQSLMTADAIELFGGVGNDWAMLALREHMGERCAFYFAFMQHYAGFLGPLALLFTTLYLILRWLSWGTYMRTLTLIGFCVPAIWAPLMIIHWRRRSNELKVKWDLRGSHEAENPNEAALFKRVVVNHRTGEMKKVYDPNNNRAKIRWGLPILLVVNFVFMVVTILPFAQWYAYGRMAPVCECCEWHMQVGNVAGNTSVVPPLPDTCAVYKPRILEQDPPSSCDFFVNCFDVHRSAGLRGFYLGFQGAVLGVWLDQVQFRLMKKFTTMLTNFEHWPTEAQYYNSLISKQFVFCWVNMYFFFLALAFLVVPFGETLQALLESGGFGWFVPMYGWLEGVVNIDEAILSPLVFAQITNLMTETVIPYLRLKLRRRKKLPTVMSFKMSNMVEARRAAAAEKARASPSRTPLKTSHSMPGMRRSSPTTGELEASVYAALHNIPSDPNMDASTGAPLPTATASSGVGIAAGASGGDGVGAGVGVGARAGDYKGNGGGAATPTSSTRAKAAMSLAGAGKKRAKRSTSRRNEPHFSVGGPSVQELEQAFHDAMGSDEDLPDIDGASSTGSDLSASSSDDDPEAILERQRQRDWQRRRSSMAGKIGGMFEDVGGLTVGALAKANPFRSSEASDTAPTAPNTSSGAVNRIGSGPGRDTAGADRENGDHMTVQVVGDVESSAVLDFSAAPRPRRDDGSSTSSFSSDSESELAVSATHQLARAVRDALGKPVKILRHTRDFNRVDAEEVLAQASLEKFHPKDDYLDMVKQYGLVLMFSIVWALAPLAAFLNNVVEVRFDAFKILLEHRRPIPREDVGIGGWLAVFESSIKLALPVVAGLAVIATGGMEWWMYSTCHVGWDPNDSRMVPDWDCFSHEWGFRLLAAVAAERAGATAVSLIATMSPYDDATRKTIQMQNKQNELAVQNTMLPDVPAGLIEDLRFLFATFDDNGNGVLNRDELGALVRIIAGRRLTDLDVSLVVSEADRNESNTITVAEFAHTLQELQEDDILSGVLGLDTLASACQRLATGIRSGAVRPQPVNWRAESEEAVRFRDSVRLFIYGESAMTMLSSRLSSRHLDLDASNHAAGSQLRQRFGVMTASARQAKRAPYATVVEAGSAHTHDTLLEVGSDEERGEATPTAVVAKVHSVSTPVSVAAAATPTTPGTAASHSSSRHRSRMEELRRLQESQREAEAEAALVSLVNVRAVSGRQM